jgi:hypothetical protein
MDSTFSLAASSMEIGGPSISGLHDRGKNFEDCSDWTGNGMRPSELVQVQRLTLRPSFSGE